ncbi:MAG: hypothetical protein JSR98_22050 [Proteobacteria bacterium]|nr:hypothetical protein [Pseudomonadota bacterium]
MLKQAPLLLAPLFVAACATVPDATVHYYRTMATTQVAVTQAVSCTPAGDRLLIGYSAVSTTVNAADPKTEVKIHIKDIDGRLANIAEAFKFSEDGRLSSVNSTMTGVGDTVLKDLLGVVGAGGKGLIAPMGEAQACTEIGKTKDKNITLTYKAQWTYQPSGSARTVDEVDTALIPDDASQPWIDKIGGALPDLSAKATPTLKEAHRVVSDVATADAVILKLNDTIPVRLSVNATKKATKATHEVWSADAVAPFVTTADDYVVAIPKAAILGKQTFALTLADSGAITELDFGKDSGVDAAVNSAGGVYNALRPRTAAEKLAELKAADDLKAEQVRAAQCNADPTTCK